MITLEATKAILFSAVEEINKNSITNIDKATEIISEKLESSGIDYDMFTIDHYDIENGTIECDLMIQTRADGTHFRESRMSFIKSFEEQYKFLEFELGTELYEIEESEG